MDDSNPLDLATTALPDDLERVGGGFRVVANGEIDVDTAPRLSAALQQLLDDGALLVVLDASDVQFLDSSGLRVIVHFGNQLSDAGGQLLIEGMSGAVRRVLEISGLIEKYRA